MSSIHPSQVTFDNSAWHLGSRLSFLVSASETGGQFALIHAHVVKGREPPRQIHENADEIVYVLEGSAEFCIGQRRFETVAGMAVVLPRGVEHSFLLHSEEAKLLMLVPGSYERYIKELSQPASTLLLPRDESLDIEQLVTTAARHGVEITGPP